MVFPPPPSPPRVASIDVYRGFVMFLMLAEVLRLKRVSEKFPGNDVWQFLGHHQDHVPWRGCSLHDLIQPSFSFLVGTALVFSVANRLDRYQPVWKLLGHAAIRSLILIGLGIFLRSVGKNRTNFTFEDTLTQIGLGYFPLVLLALAKPVWRWVAILVLLVGYGLAFALYPAPGPEFDYAAVGVTADWNHHPTGFAAHWDKNSNAAWAFDRWFLNLFPRDTPFAFNGGGYTTLSFVPTLGTMLLGLIAGSWLRDAPRSWQTVGWLNGVGLILLAAGYGADQIGLCPNVKRIWTPAWTLFSGGWCFLFLSGFVALCDVLGWVRWSFPLRVIGANSIVAYCAEHLVRDFIVSSARTHFGKDVFNLFGENFAPLVSGTVVFAVIWVSLFWLYRRKIFVRI